jgi:hypothetical protein
VETVSLKAGLQDWEMNFIQGMLNQFQFDFRTWRPSSKNTRNKINMSYKIMEVSIRFQAYRYLRLHFSVRVKRKI